MFRFVIFVCNYPGRPHIAAVIWPCTIPRRWRREISIQ